MTAEWLLRATMGLGRTEHQTQSFKTLGPNRKSMSMERTFGASGIGGSKDLLQALSQLCAGLEEGMEDENLRGKSVTLKLKLTDYTVRTRCRSLNAYVQSADEIFA